MADTHAQAAQAAAAARDKLLGVARGKAAVAVDRQVDVFAETAAKAKREWNKSGSNE